MRLIGMASGWDTVYSFYLPQGPAGSWRQNAIAHLPNGREYGVAFAGNNGIYLVGGWRNAGGATTAKVHKYDFATDTWLVKPSLSGPREQMGLALTADTAYLLGGSTDASDSTALVLAFRLNGEVWDTAAALPSGRRLLCGGCIGDTVVAIGGYNGAGMNLVELLGAPATVIDTAGANVWYVNISTGDTANSGLSAGTAKKYISNVTLGTLHAGQSLLTAGDTIFIAAGTYGETVVIDTDGVMLLGQDSATTIIDPPGAAGTAGLYAVYAETRTQLVIRDLCVTDAYEGIRLYNVDRAAITAVKAQATGNFGICLTAGSDTNSITGCLITGNANEGLGLYGSSCFNILAGNLFTANAGYACDLTGSHINTLQDNICRGNTSDGFVFDQASYNIVTGNVSEHSAAGSGFWLLNSAIRNTFVRNRASNNRDLTLSRGFRVASPINVFIQNQADSNAAYQFELTSTANSCTLTKNSIMGTPTRPDSGILNATANSFSVIRNWWGTTD
ncbi:MAG TPA: NosD domain-containing protein, partial [bacterium]|nr:NosD domain-containing protein [bacterium]